MPLNPDLFSACDPPAISVQLEAPITGEANDRQLVVRLKERGKRSISASVTIDRYAPEDSIFRAISETMRALSAAHEVITRQLLATVLAQQVKNWVEPF